MNKITSYILLVVVIALALVIGIIIGLFYQKQTYAPQLQVSKITMQSLSSKVVSAVVTYGSVKSVDNNRSIVLSYDSDELSVLVDTTAKIYRYENSSKKEIQFSDIKVGDLVNITTSVSSDGLLHGNMVVIFASAK